MCRFIRRWLFVFCFLSLPLLTTSCGPNLKDRVKAFQEAHNGRDVEKELSFFADDSMVEGSNGYQWKKEGRQEVRSLLKREAVFDDRLFLTDFKVGPNTVTCKGKQQNFWLETAGIGTVYYDSLEFTFEEGLIKKLKKIYTPESGKTLREIHEPFGKWLLEKRGPKIDEIVAETEKHGFTEEIASEWLILMLDWREETDKESSLKKENEIAQRPLILFDAFKEQAWSIKDTGFAGYSSLNLFLKNLGYRTQENHRPYKESLAGLGPETLLVIGVAMEAEFTDDEVNHILEFVDRGGNILVIAEHENKYNSSDFLRPIINAGGWEINNDRVVDYKGDAIPDTDGRWIRTVLPSDELGPVLLCAATLTALRDDVCEVLLTSLYGGNVVAGLGKFGKGKIAVITDSEFLWNANPDYKWRNDYTFAFNDLNTRAFIKDLIFKILPPPQNMHEANDFLFSSELRSSKRVFVYGNGGDFENYSKFFEALNNANISVYKYREGIKVFPEDKVIVITPLMKIPQQVIDELSKSGKMVLFGDMYSSVESYADSWEHFFKPHKIYPLPYPANALAEKYDVSFLPFFGVNFDNNENGNILYIPVFFNGQRLCLHKACAVNLLKGNEKTKLSFENFEGTFACGAGFGLNHTLKSVDPHDMKNPDFLIVTDRVLAVGDSDVITDVFFYEAEHAGIINEIIKFLKS